MSTSTTSTAAHASHQAPAALEASGESARVLCFPEPGRVAMREAALRVAGADEVVVATSFSSISAGTERLLFEGKLPGFPHLRFPLVPGYEAAGVVVWAGQDVREVRVGDEVFVGGSMCYTDVAAAFGGQSSTLIKKSAQVVPLHGIPLDRAPLLALAATSLHGVNRLGDVAGKRVGVLGLGAIGQFAARFLDARGATVVAADVRPERLAASPGERIDLTQTPFDEAVRDLVAVVEATGRSEEIARCARAVRPGGQIALLSYYDELRTPYVDLFVKEVSLLVAREWAHPDLLAARDALAAGVVDPGPLAGHVVPVQEYERAYRTAFEDPTVLKVILAWA
jgi:3-hydroxyethyl bacteriochlorophyllide a dehydrogenase